MKANRRSVLLINPKFQFRFIATLFIPYIISIFIISIFLYSISAPLLEEIVKLNLPPGHPIMEILEQTQKHLIYMVLTIVICLSCIFAFVGLSMSHKVAGPLYKLNMQINNMIKNGHLEKVRFRKNDYFMEVADSFNAFLKRYFDYDGN